MKLVETKTYKINMAHTERLDLCKLANKLDEIANVFVGKKVYYTVIDDGEYLLDIEEIHNVAYFFNALAEERVSVY